MAAIPALSSGSIASIMTGDDYDKPVLQILGTKKIVGSEQERYRLLVSDGKHLSSFAMLATQLNYMCNDGLLTEFTIVRLDRYINSSVSKTANKRVLVILEMTILKEGSKVGKRVGNPEAFTESTNNGTTTTSSVVANPISPPSRPSTSEKKMFSNNSNNSYNGMMNHNESQKSQINRELTNPIVSLSPYQNKWVIKARVTFKSAVRTWSNAKGEGKLFSMDLMDESGEIRATAFKEQCDKFFDMIEVDRVYYISKCQLKPANKQYTSIKNDYEMTFTNETVVELCEDDTDAPIPQVKYNFIPISKITDIEPKSTVDVIGLCLDVAELQTFTSKTTNRELTKRELTLIDKSDASVNLTLWGDEAIKFNENIATTKPIVLIKNARVTEFNGGKSLSNGSGTVIKINPDMDEGHQLRGWYDNGLVPDSISSVSARTGGGNIAAEWLTFHEVQEKNLGTGDKPDYFQCKSVIHKIRSENCAYKACSQENCNKKIVDEGDGHYRCEKCNAVYPDFKWRLLLNMLIGDWSGNRYVTCFNDVAEQLLGKSASEVGNMLQNDASVVSELFSNQSYRSFIFKLRSKVELYGDVSRNKMTAMSVSPFSKDYNKYLISHISRLTGIGKQQN